MTLDELQAQIDSQITDQTADNSITPIEIGENMKAIAAYARGYKRAVIKLEQSGGTVTPVYLQNDFTGTFTWSLPSNGLIRAELTGNELTGGKTFVIVGGWPETSVAHHVTVQYGLLPIILDLEIKRHDNDQSSTPNFQNLFIEIRVYP